jgi:ATP-dependent DNA helicase RecG
MRMENFNDLLEQLQTGDESVRLEAKTAEEIGKSIIETVSAFSNEPGLGGGHLILGVRKQFTDSNAPLYEIVGIKDPDKIQLELATQCSDKTLSSSVRPQMEVHQVNGKNVISVFIPEAQPHEKPVFISGRGLPKGAFRRIGSADVVCTNEDLVLLYSLRSNQSFDATAVEDSSVDDLDPRAIQEYRRARAELNPGAIELEYDDADLLYALGATTKAKNGIPTLAGMLLFGRAAALRRFFPLTRVDYIRVSGREWVRDPENRFDTLDLREPLMLLVRRVVSQILDDIPKAVKVDALQRREVSQLPFVVVREAVVNALMHRNYRVNQPVQIIRYSNRLEIRNAGYSLKPEEQLGVPGSVSRNPRIAEVLHEAGLAETKGSGIRAMRDRMRSANLILPAFESDREKDQFTLTLLLHNLASPGDLRWLEQFKDLGLTSEDVQALLFLREVGAITNSDYGNINTVEKLVANKGLQRLQDFGLIEQKGRGATAFFVLTDRVMPESDDEVLTPSHEDISSPDKPISSPDKPESSPGNRFRPLLPPVLETRLKQIGQRTNPRKMQTIIVELCKWQPMRLEQIADLLQRNKNYVQEKYLKPLIDQGILEYVYPEKPTHPQQTYRIKG